MVNHGICGHMRYEECTRCTIQSPMPNVPKEWSDVYD